MNRLEELMVQSYVRLVKAGRRDIGDVPASLRDAVREALG